MSTLTVPHQQYGVLLNVDWAGYVQIGEILGDQPIRMNYSCGSLEIMPISREHERVKSILRRLVETIADELDLDIGGNGSMTVKREALDRGLEADECYWIEHEEQMRDRDTFDPDVDPPPDLAIEVEMSRTLLNRLRIYAALGVPEIWRYDGKKVQVLLRGDDGQYHPSSTSKALPMFPVAELARFLEMRQTLSDTNIGKQFRTWVREQMADNWGAKKPRGRKKT